MTSLQITGGGREGLGSCSTKRGAPEDPGRGRMCVPGVLIPAPSLGTDTEPLVSRRRWLLRAPGSKPGVFEVRPHGGSGFPGRKVGEGRSGSGWVLNKSHPSQEPSERGGQTASSVGNGGRVRVEETYEVTGGRGGWGRRTGDTGRRAIGRRTAIPGLRTTKLKLWVGKVGVGGGGRSPRVRTLVGSSRSI